MSDGTDDPPDGGAPPPAPSNDPPEGGAPPPSNDPPPADPSTPSNDPPPGGAPAPSNDPPDGGAPAPSNDPPDGGAPQPVSNDPQDGGAPPGGAPPPDDGGSTVPAGRGDGDGGTDGTNTVAGPLTISLKVQCGDTSKGVRSADGSPSMGKLQIVPTSGQVTDSPNVSILGGQLSFSATIKKAGTDTLQAQVTSYGAGDPNYPSPQIAITQSNPPADSDWTDARNQATIPDPPVDPGKGYAAVGDQPTEWYVFARSHPDDILMGVQVDVYPGTNLSATLSDNFCQAISSRINDALKIATKAFDKLPFTIAPQITLPAGSISIASGWAENSDWTAAFGLSLSLNLNPLLGISVKFTVKALDILGLMVDVPPSVVEYLGGINLSFALGGQISINGTVSFKGPAQTNSVGASGSVDLTVSGEAVFGDKDVASASVEVSAKGGITWSGTFDNSGGGLVWHQTLTPNNVVGSFKITLKACTIEESNAVQYTILQLGDPVTLPDWQLIAP